MTSTSVPLKNGVADPYASVSSPLAETSTGSFSPYRRFAQWRANLGLPYPGNIENITKEVKGALCSSSGPLPRLLTRAPLSSDSPHQLLLRWSPC